MPAHEKNLDEHFAENTIDDTQPSQERSSTNGQVSSVAELSQRSLPNSFGASPYQPLVGLPAVPLAPNALAGHNAPIQRDFQQQEDSAFDKKYVAYTIKLPSDQLAALQTIWLELKRLYGTHSPDKSGMIQQAIADWLRRWDGPERPQLLQDLLEIRQDTRRRQYRK